LSYILYRRIEYNYPLSLIGNIDETPMTFNLPSQTTIEERGKRTVSILTTGHERTHFTVTLACLADGTKLPPFIIFKLVKVSWENFSEGIHVHTNLSGWMDEKEMIWWVENVWRWCVNLGSNPRSLLVLDSFSAHKTDSLKQRYNERNTDIAIIPGGLTSRLQPLDVSLNKSFKAKVRHAYNQWMDEAIKEYTPSGKIKRPSYSLVANWVKEAWDNIEPAMIRKSFKCCGISIELNGSKDNLIFDFEKVSGDKDRGIGIEEEGESIPEENENDKWRVQLCKSLGLII